VRDEYDVLNGARGDRKLDAIKSEHVQRLKHDLQTKSPKTVNNILAVLSVTLRKAVEWEVIDRMPCSIKLLPPSRGSTEFYDFNEFERLVEAARLHDARTHLIVLLGGEAGMRIGEMIALEWTDVDLASRQVCIGRSDWNGTSHHSERWPTASRSIDQTAHASAA
jgi:integrase